MDILVDLDGTLTDCRHRQHYLDGKKDWDSFFGGMFADPPNRAVLSVVVTMEDMGHKIIYCTGRPNNYRIVTKRWLIKHQLQCELIYMRKAGDFRADHVIKFELLQEIREDGHRPDFVIDDRPSVISMWRRQGLPVFQYLQPEDALNNDVLG